MKGEFAEKIRLILRTKPEHETKSLLQLIPCVVDTVLHHLLWTSEQDSDLQLGIRMGVVMENLGGISDGLPGELYTQEGWIARYSKEDRCLS